MPRTVARDVEREAIKQRSPRFGRLAVALAPEPREAFLRDVLQIVLAHANAREKTLEPWPAVANEACEPFSVVVALGEESRHAKARATSTRAAGVPVRPRGPMRLPPRRR